MPSFRPLAAAALCLCLGAPPTHALIINLDAKLHVVGGTLDQPLSTVLPAGNWVIQPVGAAGGGAYDAFSPWASNSNCNPSCVPSGGNQGWLHRYGVRVGGTVVVDPVSTWNGLAYASPLNALAAGVSSALFLGAATTVEFYIPTGEPLSDNRGGISLELLTPLDVRSSTWGRIKQLYR
jgi:hypothetical protein